MILGPVIVQPMGTNMYPQVGQPMGANIYPQVGQPGMMQQGQY